MSFGFGKAPAAPGGFGAPAPAAGGFGGAPAAGGFGTAPVAGGFGAPAAPAAGGFGAPPAATGGFGAAPAAGGFGAPPAAGGFGKAPAAAGGFGAPAAGGFGAPAAGGFGAPPAGGFGKAPAAPGGFGGGFGAAPAAGGFGAPAAGGFGAPAAGGFGAAPAAPQTGLGVGGFGTAPPPPAPAAGGFGAPAATAASSTPASFLTPVDLTRQSTVVRYLLEIDNAHNALHPNCKFRTFVYNMCTPGQGELAISRERYAAASAGGGCKEEDWIVAQRNNPNPENMYPYPVHFFQGLKTRVDKQVAMFDTYHKHVDEIEAQVRELEDLQNKNAAEYETLQVDQTMLERRWLAVATKIETMRQLGLPIGDEKEALYDKAQQMLQDVRTDGRFSSAAGDLDRLLDVEAARASARAQRRQGAIATSSSTTSSSSVVKGDGIILPSSSHASSSASLVEPHVLKDWKRFLERLQDGLESLKRVVDKDTNDACAARRYLSTKN